MLRAMARDGILLVGGSGGIGAGLHAHFGERSQVWSRRSGVDATDEASVARATEAMLRDRGAPWALVHCVGCFTERSVLDSDLALYRELVDSNLTSAFVVGRSVIPAMVEAGGGGRVLFFAAGGVEDRTAKTRAPIYFAAKAALVSLARSLAAELAPHQITVNVISPGIIRHPDSHTESQDRMESRVPLGRPGDVADVVPAVELLLGEGGAYITGTNLDIDGGLSL